MPKHAFTQVDVFTTERFGGNQLAVFTDARGLSTEQMQTIAREMNYAESTFVLPPEDRAHDARVRIFTTTLEMPFAGHPTVGTAWVLGRARGQRRVTVELNIGPIAVEVDPGDGMAGSATMEQPLPTFRPSGVDVAPAAAMLGLAPGDIATYGPIELGSAGAEFLFIPLASVDAVARARPVVEAIHAHLGDSGFVAAYCFALGGLSPAATAHSRMFFPAPGDTMQEDPATGSAAGPFGAYLVTHRLASPGTLLIEQGYELGRPSQLDATIETDGEAISRVRVGGGVVYVAEGTLVV